MSFSSDFLTWLAAPARRCLLADVGCKSGGSEITRRLSTVGFVTEPADTPASTTYNGRISGGLQFTRSLDLSGQGGSINYGDLEIDNEDGALDSWLGDIWTNRPITLWMGAPTWPKSQFEVVFVGTIGDIARKSRSRLALSLRDILAPLNSTLSTATVGGTGDNATALKPVCLGEAFNVAPILLDAAGQRYAYHYTGAIGCLEVRDNGVPAAFTDYPGQGYFDLTNARFGEITCDAQGVFIDWGGGVFSCDAAVLIALLATVVGDGYFVDFNTQFDLTNWWAMHAAYPQNLGAWITQRANRLQEMQRCAATIGATVTVSAAGLVRIIPLAFGTPSRTINTRQIVDGSFTPVWTIRAVGSQRLAGCRNWTPQVNNLAGSLQTAAQVILTSEWSYATASDSTVLTDRNQTSDPQAGETLFVDETDLADETTRRLDLWKVDRMVWGFECLAEMLDVELGDTITVEHPRIAVSGSATALVVSVAQNYATARVTLQVLV